MHVKVPVAAVGSAFARGCTLPPPSEAIRAAWLCGRRRYAVWLIEADTPTVRALAAEARERLAPWLLPAPTRQPHITLCACGFAVRNARAPDDYGRGQRRAQLEALRPRLPASFTLRVGGLGSFNGCAFLRVADEQGRLAALQDRLTAGIPQARAHRFVPHVTIGFYRRPVLLQQLMAAAADFDGRAELPVWALTVASYDPRAADTPLRYWRRLPLS